MENTVVDTVGEGKGWMNRESRKKYTFYHM